MYTHLFRIDIKYERVNLQSTVDLQSTACLCILTLRTLNFSPSTHLNHRLLLEPQTPA
jgi:hypothetical protein